MKIKTLLLASMTLAVLALVGCGRNADNSADTNTKPAAGEMTSTNAVAPATPAATTWNNTNVPAETNIPAVTNQ